ncbi:MAG: Hpt domain-containing protein [Acetobacteraceae bacterium]|nr:Hpt domain-containing protein [Acetobacteraceae bacterium]
MAPRSAAPERHSKPLAWVATGVTALAALAAGGLWFAELHHARAQAALRLHVVTAAGSVTDRLAPRLLTGTAQLSASLADPASPAPGAAVLDAGGLRGSEPFAGAVETAIPAAQRLLPRQTVLIPGRAGTPLLVKRGEGELPSLAVMAVPLGEVSLAVPGVALRVLSRDGQVLAGPARAEAGPSALAPLPEGDAWVEASASVLAWPVGRALLPPALGALVLVAVALLRRRRREPVALETLLPPPTPEQMIAEWPHPAALLDQAGQVVAWNPGFESEVARVGLRPDVTAAQFWRAMLPAGGRAVAARLALIGPTGGEASRHTRDGRRIIDRVTAIGNGRYLLECRVAPAEDPFQLCTEELRARLPLLRAAVQAAELRAAREHAHAMRGLAGNFGLNELLPPLVRIEDAARGGDAQGAAAALAALESQFLGALATPQAA